MIKMSFNRCKNIHKFGNKYLPSAYKTQVEFRSHFSGKSASYGPRNTVIRNSFKELSFNYFLNRNVIFDKNNTANFQT